MFRIKDVLFEDFPHGVVAGTMSAGDMVCLCVIHEKRDLVDPTRAAIKISKNKYDCDEVFIMDEHYLQENSLQHNIH